MHKTAYIVLQKLMVFATIARRRQFFSRFHLKRRGATMSVLENPNYLLACKIVGVMRSRGLLKIWVRRLQFLLWKDGGVRTSAQQIEAAMGYYAYDKNLFVLDGMVRKFVVRCA